MSLYQNKYRAESVRLQTWNYSNPGYYFITVCTQHRVRLFGAVLKGVMHLSDYGEIVREEWNRSYEIRSELVPDAFVIMPNHFHAVVHLVSVPESKPPKRPPTIENGDRRSHSVAGLAAARVGTWDLQREMPCVPPRSISTFMAGVKSVITKRINIARGTPAARVLQYDYHDHVIRNRLELTRIRQYIKNNPRNWKEDCFHR